jgi:hypothetical protein
MQQGLLGRISRTTVMEYHAFGIIRRAHFSRYIDGSTYADSFSEGTHAEYHYMVCGVQGELSLRLMCLNSQKLLGKGDFTRGLVNDPPRTLWTRQLKVSGLFVIRPYARLIVAYFIVRRRIEHFHTLQTWRSDMHRHRYWGCPVNLHPVS